MCVNPGFNARPLYSRITGTFLLHFGIFVALLFVKCTSLIHLEHNLVEILTEGVTAFFDKWLFSQYVY